MGRYKKIEKQLKIFLEDKNQNIGVVGTWWKDIFPNKDEITHTPFLKNKTFKDFLSSGGLICGSSSMIPRKVWIKVGGLDTNMKRGTDSDLFRRIIQAGYEAKNLKEFCVFCDALPIRMTTINTTKKLINAIFNNLYIIKKYNYLFLKYPIPLIIRILRIVKYILKIFINQIKFKN